MKRVLVLQLARLGDIIQTLPAVQGLKKADPETHVTLVVRSTFAEAARLSPYIDEIIEFPSEQVLGPVISDRGAKAESLARLIRWVGASIIGREYDLLLNLTFSPASAYLASLVRAKEKRGVLASLAPNTGPYAIPDPWSLYFFAQVVEHNLNIIHVNDLFARIAGAELGAWPLELREPPASDARPRPPALAPGRPRIGIQLTASTPEKTLSVEAWTTVCRELLATHADCELMFFGAKADLPAIKSVVGALGGTDGRCHIAAGRLRFQENTAWLRSCDWLVSPDTAIVHLASAVGTRVIQVSLGNTRPDDTGPYGEGHFVLYPMKADAATLAQEIARIVRSGGAEKARTKVAQAITRLTPTTSGAPRNEIIAHNFTQDEVSEFFMQAYFLLAEFRCSGRLEDIPIPKFGGPGQGEGLDRLVAAYDALCSARRLAEFGQHYCLKMLENLSDVALLKDLMQKLSEIDEMLLKLQNSVFMLKPLIDTWRVSKDVAYWPSVEEEGAGGGLEETLALTEGCYRELGQNVDILQQLLQTSVEASQGRIKTTNEDKARSTSDVSKEGV